jgi:GT2 family glycosyltransferase
MRFLLGIPVVRRSDLLVRALDSVRALWPHTLVIDNSEAGLIPEAWPVPILRPQVSLSFAQTMNLLGREATEQECDALLFMHDDAEAVGDTTERFLGMVDEAIGAERRWGVAFTRYDCLAALSTRMIREVGEWDTVLPQYFSDCDYYRRVQLAGFELIDTALPVVHVDQGSNTLRGDARREFLNRITLPLYAMYYATKWGGQPGQEKFAVPFNGGPSVQRQQAEPPRLTRPTPDIRSV